MTNNPGLCEAKSLRRPTSGKVEAVVDATVYEKAITITNAEMKPPQHLRRGVASGMELRRQEFL
jgi:hypothetical protein